MEKQKRKYSEEEEEILTALYEELGTDGISAIALDLGRTEKSVIAKLVRMGVYTPASKVRKRRGPSKKELLRDLEKIVGFDTSGFNSASKTALSNLLEFLNVDK